MTQRCDKPLHFTPLLHYTTAAYSPLTLRRSRRTITGAWTLWIWWMDGQGGRCTYIVIVRHCSCSHLYIALLRIGLLLPHLRLWMLLRLAVHSAAGKVTQLPVNRV